MTITQDLAKMEQSSLCKCDLKALTVKKQTVSDFKQFHIFTVLYAKKIQSGVFKHFKEILD